LDLLLYDKKASYSLESEGTEPDSFVQDLCKHLAANDELMTSYLPQNKARFIFGGLGYAISNILIRRLKNIKVINNFGVSKMCRNVFLLQHSLSALSSFGSAQLFALDRVRKYYELLNLSEGDLIAQLSDSKTQHEFSREEYRVLFSKIVKKHQRKQVDRILDQIFQPITANTIKS